MIISDYIIYIYMCVAWNWNSKYSVAKCSANSQQRCYESALRNQISCLGSAWTPVIAKLVRELCPSVLAIFCSAFWSFFSYIANWIFSILMINPVFENGENLRCKLFKLSYESPVFHSEFFSVESPRYECVKTAILRLPWKDSKKVRPKMTICRKWTKKLYVY